MRIIDISVGQKAPSRDVVTEVTVKEIVPDKRRVVLATICRVGETVVLEGEAALLAAA